MHNPFFLSSRETASANGKRNGNGESSKAMKPRRFHLQSVFLHFSPKGGTVHAKLGGSFPAVILRFGQDTTDFFVLLFL